MFMICALPNNNCAVCFGYSSNPTHQRIKALEKLADGTLRQDIISGGLAEWIVSGTSSMVIIPGSLYTSVQWQNINAPVVNCGT